MIRICSRATMCGARWRFFPLLMIIVYAPVVAYAAGPARSTAAEDELATLVLAACRQRESFLLDRGVAASFEIERESNSGPCLVQQNWSAKGAKWHATITFKRSVDVFIVPGQSTYEFGNDGFEQTYLTRLTAQGLISLPTHIATMDGTLDDMLMLASEYWLTIRGSPLSDVIDAAIAAAGREGRRLTPRDGAPNVLEVPLGLASPTHLAIHVNPQRNYAIELAERYYNEQLLNRRFLVSEMRDVGDGVWVPKRWSLEFFGQTADGETVLMRKPEKWSMPDVKINAALDDASFPAEFPLGTFVANNITGGGFQVGGPKGGTDADRAIAMDLWKKAKQLPSGFGQKVAHHNYFWIVAVNIALLALIGLYYRRRTRRAP
jgi:hypothetical protein